MTHTIDLKGLKCPVPLLKTQKYLKGLVVGDVLDIRVTDPDAVDDLKALSEMGRIDILSLDQSSEAIIIKVEKTL